MCGLLSKFSEGGWNVAVRPMPAATILRDQQSPFQLIPNAARSWAADPFIYEADGCVYIFAELFDYLKRRGSIGYTCLQNGSWQKWTVVIDEPFHMSYPNVFYWNDGIYMVPETSSNRSLRLYKAVSFPDRWELVRLIATDVAYVDTTFFTHNNQLFAITTDIGDETNHKDLLLQFDADFNLVQTTMIPENSTVLSRSAGNFIRTENAVIRITQDCDGHYGKGLVFSQFDPDDLQAHGLGHVLLHLLPTDVAMNQSRRWTGLHTYNATSNYEVVDIERPHYNPLGFIGRLMFKLKLIK